MPSFWQTRMPFKIAELGPMFGQNRIKLRPLRVSTKLTDFVCIDEDQAYDA
jgi:hypothetical protein